MEFNMKFFIIFSICVLVIIIYVKITLVLFTNKFKTNIAENESQYSDLITFAYDIYFKPPTDKIVIENPYNCTPMDLRPCKLDDGLSCIGCKSLIARCINFTKDTTYIDHNGVETIIPANTSPNDGYCLTQTNPTQLCNPYHGDLVLVQTAPDALESMLYCDCKQPGLVGKSDILGSCDEPFICDGKVDDVNQPLEDIECQCENDMISTTSNNIPTCIIPTIEQFTDFDNPTFYDSIETVSKDRFNKNISGSGKFPGKFLKNPCKYCLFTGVYIANGEMVKTDDDGWQCVMKSSKQRGLAIRRDRSSRLLKGAVGPDAVIDVKLKAIITQGYIHEVTFEQMTGIMEVGANESILKYLNVPRNLRYAYINLYGHELVFPGSFGSMYMTKFPGIVCDGPEVAFVIWDDFAYSCFFSNEIWHNRKPSGHSSYMIHYGFGMSFETAPKCPPKHHSILTGAAFNKWMEYENLNSAHSRIDVNGLAKYEIRQDFKDRDTVRYICSVFDFTTSTSKHFATESMDLYKKWYSHLIPKKDS
nr:PIF-1 [Menippe mercenaria nudivirus]